MELFLQRQRDGEKRILLVSILVLVSIVTIPLVYTDVRGDSAITFVSVVANENETQTWTYNIMVTSPQSHWIITWCGGPNSIVNASHDYIYSENLDSQGNIRLCGIRFEIDLEQKGSSVICWFTLDGVYQVGIIDVELVDDSLRVIGRERILDTVIGPVLTGDLALRRVVEGINAVYRVAGRGTDKSIGHWCYS